MKHICYHICRPHTEGCGMVMFSVCLSIYQGGREYPSLWSQVLLPWYPYLWSQVLFGCTHHGSPARIWVPPAKIGVRHARLGVAPPPPRQVTLLSVRLLRFPTGGISYNTTKHFYFMLNSLAQFFSCWKKFIVENSIIAVYNLEFKLSSSL